MAIRHLLLAALVYSAFSAHAGPTIYATTQGGTILLATSSTGQVQTYMPRAVEGFFMYTAPSAAPTAPVVLAESGQATAAPPAQAPVAVVVQAPSPEVEVLKTPQPAPAEVPLADSVEVGASPGLAAELTEGAPTGAALAPTILLPQAIGANALPEPGTSGLLLAGLAGVGFMARRRRSH
jgi:hypothetical protein